MWTFLLPVSLSPLRKIGLIHVLLSECIMGELKRACVCPTCKVPVQVKGLHKNLTFSTLVACAGKLKDILEVRQAEQQAQELLQDSTDFESTQIDGNKMGDILALNSSESEELKENSKIADENSLLVTPKPSIEKDIDHQSEPRSKRLARRTTPKVTPTMQTAKERMKTPVSAPTERKKNVEKVAEVKETLKVLMSGLKPDDKNLITEYHKEVEKGSKVQIASDYDSKTVNRIVMGVDDAGLCIRTTKYLRGILDGKQIVTFSWFFDSLSQKKWLNPSDYLVKGDTSIGKETDAVRLSLERSPGTKLFNGFTFYLAGRFSTPSKLDLTLLLKAGGAKVSSVRPKLPLSENHFIIYDPDLLDDGHFWITEEIQRSSGLWVLDCISSYEILPTY